MCVNNLSTVALDSGVARIRTRDLLIASPAPYRYAIEPNEDGQLLNMIRLIQQHQRSTANGTEKKTHTFNNDFMILFKWPIFPRDYSSP